MKLDKTILLHQFTPEEFKEYITSELTDELKKLIQKLDLPEPIEYLTRKEVAKILKVSIVTLSQWDKHGILQPYRIGNLIRYKSNKLDKALIKIPKGRY